MMPGREGAFNVLPKPYAHTHPALWVAAGNPGTYERAARNGLGLLGFNIGSVWDMKEHIQNYKKHIGDADPIGEYVNDNVMVTVGLTCQSDRQRARELAASPGSTYLGSLVYRYHDTFPRPEGLPRWPELIPEPPREHIDAMIQGGYALVGDPDEIIQQLQPYQDFGCDQLVFSVCGNQPPEAVAETVELFGKYVIPEFDKDPVHSTVRYREAAGGPLVPRGD